MVDQAPHWSCSLHLLSLQENLTAGPACLSGQSAAYVKLATSVLSLEHMYKVEGEKKLSRIWLLSTSDAADEL